MFLKPTLLSAVTLTISRTLASPLVPRDDSTMFYIKTANDAQSDRNGLYIGGYHTGAGLADAVAWPNSSYATPAFLNNTQLQFNGTYPDAMVLGSDTNYADWEPVSINAGYGTPGFSLDRDTNQLVWNSSEFGGWLLCDWYHDQTPQLFWRYSYYMSTGYPCNCGAVDLVAEAAAS